LLVSQAELIAQKRSANVRTDQQRLDSFSFKLSGENSYVLPVNMACRMARLAFVVRKECRHPVDAPLTNTGRLEDFIRRS
jgi:hypothetical protein